MSLLHKPLQILGALLRRRALLDASSSIIELRLIDQGGVKLNDKPVQSATAVVSGADLDEQGTARLAVGKKRHGLINRG